MIITALHPTPNDLREAEAIERLADQLTHIADTAIAWRDEAAYPLASRLRTHGDLASDAARVEFVAFATIFQLAFCELKEALVNAQAALDRDTDTLPGMTLDEANALKAEIARRHPGAKALIQIDEMGSFYLLAYLPTPIFSRDEYEAWLAQVAA